MHAQPSSPSGRSQPPQSGAATPRQQPIGCEVGRLERVSPVTRAGAAPNMGSGQQCLSSLTHAKEHRVTESTAQPRSRGRSIGSSLNCHPHTKSTSYWILAASHLGAILAMGLEVPYWGPLLYLATRATVRPLRCTAMPSHLPFWQQRRHRPRGGLGACHLSCEPQGLLEGEQ